MKSPVKPAIRRYVLERDNWTCQYCGTWMSLAEATVDHIQPASLGGEHYGHNLRAACKSCNCRKQDRSAEWLRQYLAFIETPYAAVITMEQYHQLRGMGVQLPELEHRLFHFEGIAA